MGRSLKTLLLLVLAGFVIACYLAGLRPAVLLLGIILALLLVPSGAQRSLPSGSPAGVLVASAVLVASTVVLLVEGDDVGAAGLIGVAAVGIRLHGLPPSAGR